VPGRMCAHHLQNGAVLIDDSYNANPGSLSAAINVLVQKTPSWLVLGDMRELGAEAENLHANAGKQAKKAGISRLFALGELSAAAANAFGDNAQCFDTHDALIATLQNELAHTQEPPTILIKGSRGSAMERVVNALIETQEARHAA